MIKRNTLIVAIILMTVGFAALTTNLVINGSATIGNNVDDFDIRFTEAVLEGRKNNSLINEDGTKIIYETKPLLAGDTSELTYEITNNSSQYDVSVSINCIPKGNISDTNLYTIDITDMPDIIRSKTSEYGSIKISLTETITESISEEFECELNITALERTSEVSPKEYGVKRLLSSSDTTWERIGDSVGLVATATHDGSEVENDFDSIYPWSEIITYNYDDVNKVETAVYGDDNFAFDGSNGQVLTRIPEFYYKREQSDGYEYVYISTHKLEGYTKSNTFSVGRYTMSGDSNHVYSKSGAIPLVSTTITDYRNYARTLGEDFGQLDYHYFILQLLYLVEYADYNSQSILGQGYTGVSNASPTASGGCNSLGMKSGTLENDGMHSVIYRGIEDIFGNVVQLVDGINIRDNQAYICYDKNQYATDIFTGCYQPVGYVNATTDGYTSKLGYDSNYPLVSFPIEVNGNSTTYVGDYYYSRDGDKIVVVGGRYNHSTDAGLWYWNNRNVSRVTSENFGARLLRYQ